MGGITGGDKSCWGPSSLDARAVFIFVQLRMQSVDVSDELLMPSQCKIVQRRAVFAVTEKRFGNVTPEPVARTQPKPKFPIFISQTFQGLVVPARMLPILFPKERGISEIVAIEQAIQVIFAGTLFETLCPKHLEIGVCEGVIGLLQGLQAFRNVSRLNQVVSVQRHDQLAVRRAETGVARRSQAAIRLFDVGSNQPRCLLQYRQALRLNGAVVHQDHFGAGISLRGG